MEQEVGITVFRSGSPGYSAILKHRYKDFVVNEIDGWGNVVQLTTNELPHNERVETEKPTPEAAAAFR